MLYRVVLICIATVASLAHQPGQAGEPKDPAVVLSSKVATDGDFITLPVKVGEKWRTFMVDTGTPVTTFDVPLVKELQKADQAMRARVPRQEAIPDLYVPPKMIVTGTTTGEIEFPTECAVMSDDLSRVRAASKQTIEGVLGMDFFEHYAMELDLAVGTLRLFESRSLSSAQHDATLEIDIIDRRPWFKVRSQAAEFWVLVDTGALLTLDIERKVYDRLVARRQLWQWPLEMEFDGKRRVMFSDYGWLDKLKVGPFTHYTLAVNCHEPYSMLGLYYWRRYRCLFDFPTKQVFLDKGPLFDVVDDTHHAGLYVQAGDEKGKIVTHIIKDSCADEIGIRVGDRLVRIDGDAVESDSEHAIYRRLSFRLNRTCELRLVRDGKEFQITLPATGLQPARYSE